MRKKIDMLREYAENGDWHSAIRLAASFPRLGDQKKDIMQAKEALSRPAFQKQLGRDPSRLIDKGVLAMKEKWSL